MESLYRNRKAILDFCFYAFIASLPFKLILAPISFGVLALVFLLFGDKKNFSHHAKQNKALLLLVAFYLFQVIGLFYSHGLGLSYNRIESQLFILVTPLLLLGLNLNLKQIEISKTVFVFSWVLFCITAFVTLLYNLAVNYEHRLDYNFVQTSMYHFHYPYDVLYINAAYVIVLFTTRLKYYRLFVSITLFVFVVLSGVRIGLLLFSLITLIYVVLNLKKLINFKSLIVILLAVLGGLMLVRNSRYVNDKFFDSLNKIGFATEKYVSEIGEEYHKLSLRQKLWSSAREALMSSPNLVMGYGPQGSREKLKSIYQDKGYENMEKMNTHNQYLTTLLNNGILGLVLLLLIFYCALHQSIKGKSLQNTLLVLITIIAFITESALERQKGVVFFSLILTLILLENNLRKTKKPIS